MMRTIQVGSIRIGPDQPLVLIGGPCVLESEALCVRIGESLARRCADLGLGYIFKASFDKANRSSVDSPRGPGLAEGLRVLARLRQRLGVPVTTDIHEPDQAAAAAEAVDLLQIPAFLCRQTELLAAAARTGRPVNVKKGQFVSPPEMCHVVDKLLRGGCADAGLMLTERGTFFGYHRLVNDFVGLADMMELGWPVCFDATHSTQLPGAASTSGGRPERAPLLATCAVAAGVQALFLEVHPEPATALSDAATMLTLETALALLPRLVAVHRAARA